MKNSKVCIAVLLSVIFSVTATAQTDSDHALEKTIKMAAGPEYKRSSFYQWLWGANYRKEWTTPVTFPVAKLDTLRGGIVKYKTGGGHQSKSLHLKNKEDKEYALRSVNKTLDVLLPKIFHHTFVQHLANDEISMSHPYGALAVPVMAEAAGIPHASPQFIFVPKQPVLDTLNTVYGNRLYLFEQRPAGDWSNNPDFLNFKKFIGSDELLDKMYDDNDNQVDHTAFIKARLFDMVIGDWDRHLDQWKWGKTDKESQSIYVPIPTDRDQVFSTYSGVLLKVALAASGQKYLHPFDEIIKDPTIVEKRFLDRLLTNQSLLEEWVTQARSLQQLLTDNVIENSIKQMPPEIFAISGNDIIAKLKSRRNHLAEYATEYYYFLAKEVEIVGSKKNEYFDINRLDDNETSVNLYKINKKGEKNSTPFYSRVFKTGETNEIRMYGLSGNDIYKVNGKVNTGIKIRIIGGDGKDSIIDNSNIKLHVYDDRQNNFVKGSGTKLHLSDSTDHTFDYDSYRYDRKGISPLLGYSNEDRLFVGIGYAAVHQKWRKIPYASKQAVGVKFSISQKALSAFYKGIFPSLIGKWDLHLNADYDVIQWINFYGIGNNTTAVKDDVPYNRTQSEFFMANAGIQRKFGINTVNLSGFYQTVRIINDAGSFISKIVAPSQPDIFAAINYAGAAVNYNIALLNDSIVPTAGFSIAANATHFQNLTQRKSFQSYSGLARFYIPLIPKISIAIRAEGGTVTGNPMFYQLPHIGGADDLRGYRRERFWGKTAFSNSNELRFITNLRSYVMNGKIGLVVFYDQGRVWQPGETSDIWHTDYGAGLLLAPFNKLLANIAYGISKEKKMIQLRIIKSF